MKRIISGVIALTLLASLALAGASCTPIVQAKTGTIEVRVTDAPPEYNIASIEVTVSAVEVHKAGNGEEGEWTTIPITGVNPFDLLQLQKEDLENLLATAEVGVGKYTQVRLTFGTVEVTLGGDGEPPEVVLPSGELKFVRPFDVVDGGTTILLLDFDANKSLVATGANKVIFKPVVKLSVQESSPHQLASIEGTISEVDTEASTVSIIPTGETEPMVIYVTPKTEITLDDEEVSLSELAELVAENGVTATVSYYLHNLKATQIDAQSP